MLIIKTNRKIKFINKNINNFEIKRKQIYSFHQVTLIRKKMLSSLIKEHQAKQSAKRVVQEQKRKECIAAANELTQALVDHLNVGVAQAYLNQKKLDAEAKLLHQGAMNFAKQTQQWLALVENFSSALKEIGDVENWARSIENDMKIITDTLERAYVTTQQPSSQ